MGKFTVGNGQYVIYARQVISQELQRVDKIREKMANLLSKDGIAMQNFMENTSEENLNIQKENSQYTIKQCNQFNIFYFL